jgi:hypothetical protein
MASASQQQSPDPKRRQQTSPVRRVLVNLLLWIGLNLVVILAAYAGFALLTTRGGIDPDAAITYALLCGIPAVLAVDLIVGVRIFRDLKKNDG